MQLVVSDPSHRGQPSLLTIPTDGWKYSLCWTTGVSPCGPWGPSGTWRFGDRRNTAAPCLGCGCGCEPGKDYHRWTAHCRTCTAVISPRHVCRGEGWARLSWRWRTDIACTCVAMPSPGSGSGDASGEHWFEQILRGSGDIHRGVLPCVYGYVSLGGLSCRWSRSSRCSGAAWSLCWVLLCVLWILPDSLPQVSLCSLLPVEDFWRWSFTLWQWSTLSKLLMRTGGASGPCENCGYILRHQPKDLLTKQNGQCENLQSEHLPQKD